jgi:hypothetical protein
MPTNAKKSSADKSGPNKFELLMLLTQPKHRLSKIEIADQIGEMDLLDSLNSGKPERSELVRWVDECLATGRDEAGAERPALRRMPSIGTAWHGVVGASNKLLLGMGEDGRPLLTIDVLNKEPWFHRSNTTLLVGFWLTRLFTTVAKCIECGRYFILRQSNRNKPYKDGTFCEAHQRARHKGQKARSIEQAREDAKATLFRLVATKFGKEIASNLRWFENARLRGRIVDFLNEAIDKDDELRAIYRSGVRDGITIKWLGYAKNRTGIVAALHVAGASHKAR